jgi:flagella basal body P-ring formation protein FlgA
MRPYPVILPAALALACCLPAQGAAAAWQELSALRAAAEGAVLAVAPGVQAHAAELDTRLRLPACTAPLAAEAAANAGGSAWTVKLRCTAPSAWSLYVPVTAQTHAAVVVLRRFVPAGQPIPAEALQVEERSLDRDDAGLFAQTALVAGRIARRPLLAGTVLSTEMVDAPVAVQRGQAVTLLLHAGPLEVRAAGRTLAAAAVGQRVMVENLDSHRTVEGLLRDDGLVEAGM